MVQKPNRQRHSIRYKGYDYQTTGAYFVTLCTKDKLPIFGQVVDSKVALSKLGGLVQEQIELLSNPPQLDILSYVVMPNHVHLIFMLNNNDVVNKIGLPEIVSKLKFNVYHTYRNYLKSGNNIVNTLHIWQRNYWERIIRKEEDLHKIAEYIERNPEYWNEEQDKPENDYSAYLGVGKEPTPTAL
jgi:putative transposase